MAGKKGTKRRKFPSMDAPDPTFQINTRMRKMGEVQDAKESLIRGAAKKIQGHKDTLAEQCKPHDALLTKLLLEIFMLAKANRKKLGKGKWKKIIRLTAGTIGWRFTSYGTTIRNVKKVIKWMEENGFDKYIRRVPEIDRQLLIRHRGSIKGKIPGVSITRKEEFGAEPDMTKVRVALPVKRLERLAKKAAKKKS